MSLQAHISSSVEQNYWRTQWSVILFGALNPHFQTKSQNEYQHGNLEWLYLKWGWGAWIPDNQIPPFSLGHLCRNLEIRGVQFVKTKQLPITKSMPLLNTLLNPIFHCSRHISKSDPNCLRPELLLMSDGHSQGNRAPPPTSSSSSLHPHFSSCWVSALTASSFHYTHPTLSQPIAFLKAQHLHSTPHPQHSLHHPQFQNLQVLPKTFVSGLPRLSCFT